MMVKVCGMTDQKNLADLIKEVGPDWYGMIYYPKSKRYLNHVLDHSGSAKRIGVFVNEKLDVLKEIIRDHTLDGVQLHGEEPPEYCADVPADIIKIKAFSIDQNFDFDTTTPYEAYVDYFLFDTKGAARGGNGVSFDWDMLENYHGSRPFVLAGGIGPNSIDALKNLSHSQFAGLDLNSKFELSPGIKNIKQLLNFKHDLND